MSNAVRGSCCCTEVNCSDSGNATTYCAGQAQPECSTAALANFDQLLGKNVEAGSNTRTMVANRIEVQPLAFRHDRAAAPHLTATHLQVLNFCREA